MTLKNNKYLFMKKIKTMTASLLLVLSANTVGAQLLQSENFETAPIGPIVTANLAPTVPYGSMLSAMTQYTAGQAGLNLWTFGSSINFDFFKISSVDAAHGNSLYFNVSDTQEMNCYLWKDGLLSAWNNRNAGNDIIQISYEMFTGNMINGNGDSSFYLFESNLQIPLVGIMYYYNTNKLVGYYNYADSSGVVQPRAMLIGNNTYPPNTWIQLTMEYNINTGAVSWRTPEGVYTPPSTYTPVTAGIPPFELDFNSHFDTLNPSPNAGLTAAFDNISVIATNASILSTKNVDIEDGEIEVYPNPVTDALNIKSKDKIKSLAVYDATGRKIEVTASGSKIDVSYLKPGIYLLTVETTSRVHTSKFIVK